MKRDGMKIGLMVALVAASGVLFYRQYAGEPKPIARVLTADDIANIERQERVRDAMAKLPGYTEAGS